MILAFANADLPLANEVLLCGCGRSYRILSAERRSEWHGTVSLVAIGVSEASPAHAEISHCPTCKEIVRDGVQAGMVAGYTAAVVPALFRPVPTRQHLRSLLEKAVHLLKRHNEGAIAARDQETAAWIAKIQDELRL